MHPNRTFNIADDASMLKLAGEIAFARIFAATPAGPRVAHAPIILARPRTLRFHLANANALAPHLDGTTALVLVEGPNGYVSANWYSDVGGAVPTWNYVAVECEGRVRRLDRDALIALLDGLAVTLEPRVGENWTRAKMEPRRFEAMLGAITAYEMAVETVRATRKASQNQPDREAARVADGLERSGAAAMAAVVRGARQ